MAPTHSALRASTRFNSTNPDKRFAISDTVRKRFRRKDELPPLSRTNPNSNPASKKAQVVISSRRRLIGRYAIKRDFRLQLPATQ